MPPRRGTSNKQQQQQSRAPPQHRVYQPGKRHMELIASVSRSSGLEKDGDALRDPKIQEEYRSFIQAKVDEYWKKYPFQSTWRDSDTADEDSDSRRNRKEMEENLLILFRKLREGLLSTQRRDAFALEVYETSLHLSVLFKSPMQTTSTLSHLFPDLYVAKSSSRPPWSSSSPPAPIPAPNSNSKPHSTLNPAYHKSAPANSLNSKQSDSRRADSMHPAPSSNIITPIPPTALATTLMFLLHQLVQAYPSQIAFTTQLRQLHPSLQDVLRASPARPAGSAPPPPAPSPSTSECSSSQSQSQSPSPSHPSTSSPPAPAAQRPGPDRSAESARTPTSAYRSPSPTSTTAASASASEPESPSAYAWVLDLARCLRARNYARLDGLTRRAVYARLIARSPVNTYGKVQSEHIEQIEAPTSRTLKAPASGSEKSVLQTDSLGLGLELELGALGTLVETLLEKARERTWNVLRTAYREVSLRAIPSAPADGAGTTGEWLARSLVLRTRAHRHRPIRTRTRIDEVIAPSYAATASGGGRGDALSGKADGEVDVDVDVDFADVEAWLEERRARGEARRKEGEGMDRRWILVKA